MGKSDLTLDDLILKKRKLWQPRKGYRMGLDAVLLSAFAAPEPGDLVADLGCGVGAVPLLLTARVPETKVYGVEIQAEMADLAKKNVRLNNLSSQVFIEQGDLTAIEEKWGLGHFDIVVSNPPYRIVGTGGRSPSMQRSIATEEISCALPQVVRAAARLVKPAGRVALVYKQERLSELISEFVNNRLRPVRLRFVHSQLEKPAELLLLEGEKQVNKRLVVEKPLIVYNDDGQYTAEMVEIFYGGD